MSDTPSRSFSFGSLLFFLVTIAVGAHISAAPLLLIKVAVAVVLVMLYGFFTVRLITPLAIESANARTMLGVLLGVGAVYLTWAVRIPAFSGWEVAFTANPGAILDSITDRASSMEVSKGFGAGTSTEGPSWLMLGTYIVEALAFVGVMMLCAVLSSPEKPKDEAGEEAGEQEIQQAA